MTFERVRAVAADVLGVPPERVDERSAPADFENWDSILQLNLVLALEQEFDVQFEPEEMERMTNVGQIAALLDEKLGS
ncbi:MAG TPA: acyl carrier protein [Pyrinomonadaceae bacterium]|nr:acyl carrier protein [Pyrinomonadaceae bacterium]